MTDDPENTTTEPRPRVARARNPGLALLATLVAIAALAVAGWGGWRQHQGQRAEATTRLQDAANLAALQSQLAATTQQLQTGSHRLAGLEAALDDQRAATQGMNRRLANLETAYATLSGQQQSGRDTLLLNDAEMLLRTAQQRFELFQDSNGALKAYAQALAVLAQVQNPAYAPVRASVETERDALAAAAPPSRQAALDALSELRGKAATLPLARPHGAMPAAASSTSPGFWSRVGHAFGGIVKVSRDEDRSAPDDGRFARQALSLDLAQAQEALLAFDDATYRSALQRADSSLATRFDADDAAVKDARARLAGLLAQRGSAQSPTLGGALAQLQSVRSSQPAAPAPAASAAAPPAPAPHHRAKP